MYKKDGVLRNEDLNFLDDNILKKRIAFIECVERIPCNPCETSCPTGAIKIGKNIIEIPEIDYSKCTGCGLCVAICPGLAIFLLKSNDKYAEITIPIELLTNLNVGDRVKTIDRKGKIIGEGEVLSVRELKVQPKRKLITLKIPKEHINIVRHFKPV